MQSKDLYTDFLTTQFPIKRVKSTLGKWERVLVVEGGIVRKNDQIYPWKKSLNLHLIGADLTQALVLVFNCPKNEAFKIVNQYIKKNLI